MTIVNPVGVLFAGPQLNLLSNYGKIQPLSTLVFLQAKTSGPLELPMTVYQDGALTTPFAPVNIVTANSSGCFPPIYTNPASLLGALRVQMFNAAGQKLFDVDPYVPQPALFYNHVVKQVATSVTSSTLITDPELIISIPGPGIYLFDGLVDVKTAGASGTDPGFSLLPAFFGAFLDHAASSWSGEGFMNGDVTNGSSMNVRGSGDEAIFKVNFALQGAGAFNNFKFRGIWSAMGPSVFAIDWAQQTTNASATIMNQGSYITVQQLQ
jgi:hypothetical protein